MDKTLKERIEKLEHGDYAVEAEVPWYKRFFKFDGWSIGILVSVFIGILVVVNLVPVVRKYVESGETGYLVSILLRIFGIIVAAGSAAWLIPNFPSKRIVEDEDGDDNG